MVDMNAEIKKCSDFSKSKFASVPFPSVKDEYWRFGAHNAWGVEGLFPFMANKLAAEKISEHCALVESAAEEGVEKTVVLFDGKLLSGESPEGVSVVPLCDVAEGDEVAGSYVALSDTGKFSLLQSSRAENGVLVRVEKGVEAKLNIKIVSSLGFSPCAVVLDVCEGANAKIAVWRIARNASFGVNRFYCNADKDSTVEFASFDFSEKNSRFFLREDWNLREGARVFQSGALRFGDHSRSERHFEIVGSRAELDARFFARADSATVCDVRTNQMHRTHGAKSNLSLKAAIGAHSRLAFTGLIKVEPQAQKTEAYQSCRSLLLDKTAVSQASPILEIIANDVQCSHGCAVSEPDSDELFYMAQRGLNRAEALALLVRGEAETAFEHVEGDISQKMLAALFA